MSASNQIEAPAKPHGIARRFPSWPGLSRPSTPTRASAVSDLRRKDSLSNERPPRGRTAWMPGTSPGMTEGVIQALAPWRAPIERILCAAIVATALLAAGAASAKNTGVGDDPLLESGPCYEALVDKNESSPTTAPKRELGAACQAEDGDIDKAWARVVRLWGSDSTDLPDYGSYVRADAPVGGAAPKWLAAIGILLTYGVLGAPLRSAARLFGAYPGQARGAAVGAVVSLIIRGLICAAFAALFGLPYVGALGAAALIAWTIVRLGRTPAAPLEPTAGSLATRLAETINDALGACLPLAALALFVQQSSLLLAIAIALALVASVGPVIAARRVLRATPLRAAIAAAALVAALGEMLVVAPPVSGWIGGLAGASLIAPVALAGLTLAAGLALARPAKFIGEGGGV